jgi:menaquinone reductase, molybdopterin-binding-like subunit
MSRVPRRRFLKVLAASSAGAVAFTGCQPARRDLAAQSRVRLAEDVLAAYDNWYATACGQCAAGCGVIVRVVEGRGKKVEGNPEHPVNRGKLCARGQAAVQEEYHPDRLRGPLVRTGERGSGALAPITWEEGLARLAERLRALQQDGRGGQVALLTPPLRAQRALLVERFVGAYGPQWLRLDPLAETPLREAVRRVFGQERLPEFDIENARYVLSFGADFLETWLSPVHYGVEYGIFRQGAYDAEAFRPRGADRPRGYLVHVGPHFSGTAANADEWVPIRPGREGALALSLAQVLMAEGLGDPSRTGALGDRAALEAYQPERVAQETGVAAVRIRQIARDLATHRPSLVLGGGTAGAQPNGTASLAAILGLNALLER